MELSQQDNQLVRWFRQSAPYLNAHRDKTIVLTLSGEAIAHANFINIVNDIALLNILGIRIVLVFGARPQINATLANNHCESQFHKRQRVTDEQAFPFIKQVIGQLQYEITAAFSMGLVNTQMHGVKINVVSGNFITAQPIGVDEGVDFCHTGRVRRVDTDALEYQLAQNAITVVPPLGYSVTGESFNLSAEEVATKIAIKLNAHKLISFCSAQGVLDYDGKLISEMFPEQAQERLAELENGGSINTGTASYLRAAINASLAGVPRCHLVSYKTDGSLLQELFSRDGVGTQIVRQSAEQTRPAKIEDVPGIMLLTQPLVEQGMLVQRTREQLLRDIEHFTVVERDGTIIGCASLYCFSGNIAEMASVATHPEYRRLSRGDLLVKEIEKQAKQQGMDNLFVLTTHSIHWFRERGFEPVELAQLPVEKQELYNLQRRSKILMKEL